ncbi:BA14K family protein [Aureimonas sp. AU40]|uniref:BA14K family protein n=1 Tax=Aureimonas sp. AU40 TaxID=1637747 RepID=UPI0009EAFEBB|nr:BA14K family protein [Aureimonas sp. AU40]
MRIARMLGGKVLAVAIALTMLPAAIPANVPIVGATAAKADPYWGGGYGYRPYRGGPGYYRGGPGPGYYGGGPGYYGGPRYYGGGPRYYRHRHNNGGAAIAGAILGLGVGAAIASANQPRYVAPRYAAPAYGLRPWTRDWYRYCASRYRSFDPGSGTFQPYNGPRQLCR